MNNSVTLEQIEAKLDASTTQEHTFWGKEHQVSYRLPCGFTVTGRSACVDPANFDVEIGRKYCREDAIKQMWLLEGYLLQNQLHESGVL